MSDANLKNAILRQTDLITQQQRQIAVLKQWPKALGDGCEKITESLTTEIEKFFYDIQMEQLSWTACSRAVKMFS